MLIDIQIISDYISRWDVLKRRVGAVTSQWIIEVLFHVNILQCFFVVENVHIPFANKGIDTINISKILNRKEVVKEIPSYFKNQSVPIVSYSYTNSIGRNIFNYKEALQDINMEEYLNNPLTCDCSHSPFQYIPSGYVITNDLNINQRGIFCCYHEEVQIELV
jgi:hypothetical protein